MKLDKFKDRIQAATREILELSAATEEVYEAVYQQLPRLEREIELTLEETAILLEYFIPQTASPASGRDMPRLLQILQKVAAKMDKTLYQMADERQMYNSVNHFLGVNNEASALSILTAMIGRIKERLMEIEIVSLNAIIFAARLGDRGRPFRVISDHVHLFSGQVAGYYSSLQETVESLNAWNDRFAQDLEIMLNCHAGLSSGQQREFDRLFSLTLESLEEIHKLLQDLMEHVRASLQPVQEIMVSIQAQDILRQGMENLNRCLQSIVAAMEARHNGEAAAPQLFYFISAVLELCIKLVRNIGEELARSLDEMEGRLKSMELRLQQLGEEGSLLAAFLGGSPATGEESTVQRIFQKVREFMLQLEQNLQELQRKMDGFSGTSISFYEYAFALENRILSIKKSVGLLQKLNLLARIELACIGYRDHAFAREMGRITENVVKEVSANEETASRLKAKLLQNLKEFEEMLALDRKKAEAMQAALLETRAELDQIEVLISRAIQALGQSCHNLMETLRSAEAWLRAGRRLPGMLAEIKVSLKKLAEEAEEFKNHFLPETGAETEYRQEVSAELELLVQKLTVYLERLTAKEVFADIDVDAGSEEGELTLF